MYLGTVRVDDSLKYPIPRFGYPPLKRPQHNFSASYNDLSFTSTNPMTKSMDTLTWSQSDALNRYQSSSQNPNRFQSISKDSFGHRSSNSAYKNSGCKYFKLKCILSYIYIYIVMNYSNVTNNDYEVSISVLFVYTSTLLFGHEELQIDQCFLSTHINYLL